MTTLFRSCYIAFWFLDDFKVMGLMVWCGSVFNGIEKQIRIAFFMLWFGLSGILGTE